MTRQKFTAGSQRPKTINIDNDLNKDLFSGAKAPSIKDQLGQA